MKKLKCLTLFTVLLILISAGIFAQNTKAGHRNSSKEINGSESTSMMMTYSEKHLSSEDLKRCSSLNQIIAKMDFIVTHPETFFRISGYDVFPG